MCPMSKNIVDAILQLNRPDIGLLPSRRQVDYNSGYTGWDTNTFKKYVNNRVIIERDHGGAGQGSVYDDGRESYVQDALCFDVIHVDPWKTCVTKEEGLKKTIDDIQFIHAINSDIRYEVGTEQAIFPMSTNDLQWFLTELQKNVSVEMFDKIEYVVIQSGVGLDVVNEQNNGVFNLEKLINEVNICSIFGKKSKEHNGDFLTNEQRKMRFDNGLSSINIGPELSIFENSLYIEQLDKADLEKFNHLCYESGLWKKWITISDIHQPNIFAKVCGHYNYSKINLPEINIVERIKNKILTMVIT